MINNNLTLQNVINHKHNYLLMKSLPIVLLSVILGGNISAQITFAPEFGVNAGAYFAAKYGTNSSKISPGIRTGIKTDIPLFRRYHLLTGLLYVRNGYSTGLEAGAGGGSADLSINTIELPLQFIYRSKGNAVAAPYCGIGPYLGFNAGGRAFIPGAIIYPGSGNFDSYRSLAVGSSAKDDIRMLDAGISITAGMKMINGIYISLLLQRGMVNLDPPGEYGAKTKSFGAGMNIGYFIHHKKVAKTEPTVKKEEM